MSLFGTETPSITAAFEEAFDTIPGLTQQPRAMAAPAADSKITVADSAESFRTDKDQERMGRLQLFSLQLKKDAEAMKQPQRSAAADSKLEVQVSLSHVACAGSTQLSQTQLRSQLELASLLFSFPQDLTAMTDDEKSLASTPVEQTAEVQALQLQAPQLKSKDALARKVARMLLTCFFDVVFFFFQAIVRQTLNVAVSAVHEIHEDLQAKANAGDQAAFDQLALSKKMQEKEEAATEKEAEVRTTHEVKQASCLLSCAFLMTCVACVMMRSSRQQRMLP